MARTFVPIVALLSTIGLHYLVANISLLPASWEIPASQAAQTLVWLSGAYLFNRLIVLIIWQGFVTKTLGRNPPRLIVQLSGVVVFFLALSGILANVYDQSVTALWATSGALGLIIGFALRNLILDTFSGLAIHMERPFKVGDFINCHTRFGEYVGRVEETNWRTTRLWTTSRTMVIIPNSFLTTTIVTNFDMPDLVGRFQIDVVLDFSVPTDRALRILGAALTQSIGNAGPLAHPAPKVRANGISPHGIEYRLRYFLNPTKVTPSKARNTIIANIASHLNHAGLSLTPPRRDVFLARMPWRQRNWNYDKDQVHQLGRLSLFSSLAEEDLIFIAERMTVKSMSRGDVVVREGEMGDSMFILAEGLLEVFIDQDDGSRLQVADLGPGTFFGEKSMLTGEKRSATIVCAADSVLCEITKANMSELMESNPEVAPLLSHAIAEREIHNIAVLSDTAQADLSLQVDEAAGAFLTKIRAFFARAS
ncbi:mechanosensitive ion channel family protein [Magnetovibrio sp.]|uniref:mechanosensitive ion channel family protein n=1 Tax=Magnetovibrio sp. TaxID=2024836 RepID=UPI002F95F812